MTKLTIKFYLIFSLFIFLFIASFFTKDAIQTNLLATSPFTHPRSPLRNPAQNTANPALKIRPRSHISARTSPLAHPRSPHPRSPLRNPAQNTANPALKIRPRSHISARLHIPNPSSHQIIVFRINLNNKDLSSITPHEYPREQSPHLEKPKFYQNAN